MEWYEIDNIEEVNSPSLVLFKDRMDQNIDLMLTMVDKQAKRLMPHVKTNKCEHVIKEMVDKGIFQFKASTLAEAELAAKAQAKFVLIAHQLVGPKMKLLFELKKKFSTTLFATLVDNPESVSAFQKLAETSNNKLDLYIDINNGMNRSGIKPCEELSELIEQIRKAKNLNFKGLHVYDGHIRSQKMEERTAKVNEGMDQLDSILLSLKTRNIDFEIIAGGTPTFSVHRQNLSFICSPGTCVFSDWGYGEGLPEQNFNTAVLLITRVISKPTEGIITLDLGHKAVAAENPIDRRFKILNLDEYEVKSQSEEHGVLEVKNWDKIKVGDVFYAIPYHICPTVNLHSKLAVIKNKKYEQNWATIAAIR